MTHTEKSPSGTERIGLARRFFARLFDFAVYDALWSLFLALVLDMNILSRSGAESLLDVAVALLLMIFLEPALLHWWGTTPGKWLLGLRVTDLEEGHLTYAAGFERVWCVLSKGWGWMIPIRVLWRSYANHRSYWEGEAGEWEEESVLTTTGTQWWRWLLLAAGYILLTTILLGAAVLSARPAHTGELTVAEYAENYNELAAYYDVESELRMDGEGNFYIEESGVIQVENLLAPEALPQLTYTLDEEGCIEAVELSFEQKGGEYWQSVYMEERCLLVWALNAEPRREQTALAEYIGEDPYMSFVRQGYATRIHCDLQYEGYRTFPATAMLIPEDGAECSFLLRYQVEYY